MSKPLLLLDVDGPLNPFKAKPERRPLGYTTFYVHGENWHVSPTKLNRNYIRVWLNPSHGKKLLSLTDLYDLAWLTTWNDKANEIVAPVVGLPTLDVLHNDDNDSDYLEDVFTNSGLTHVYFKSWFLKNTVPRDRAFVWVDDQHNSADENYLSCFYEDFNLYKVDPSRGLTDVDFDALRFIGENF